jgi:beta-phosphoglucomutase-like phosphatase (HAD superfamily)
MARGCLFDLDGVITKTAKVHNAAWKQMFDSYLRDRSQRTGEPFDPVKDYDEYVDGKPRADGTRSFLVPCGSTARTSSWTTWPSCWTIHD